MERDSTIGHGMSIFTKERFLDCADHSKAYVCNTCGLICTANEHKNIYSCRGCKNNSVISQVRIPYSMKLLIQELMSMHIAPRIQVGNGKSI